MRVRSATWDEDLPGGLFQLLTGAKATRVGAGFTMGIGFTSNTCDKLVIRTRDGELEEEGRMVYLHHALGTRDTGIEFHPLRLSYRTRSRRRVKYWVMPLLNFVSEYALQYPQLDSHPLRLVRPQAIAEGLTEQGRFVAEFNRSLKNRLIAFSLGGKAGFIEPLPDHASREEALRDGRVQCVATAVMVGEVAKWSNSGAHQSRRVPFGLLQLLSIATGSRVGTPWVEFRDAEGHLLGRMHNPSSRVKYSRGHAAMREWIHRGTGYLMSRAAASGNLEAEPTPLVLNLLLAASSYSGYIEDRFDCLFRAFEALYKAYTLKKPTPLVSGPCRTEVVDILREAAADVERLQEKHPDAARALGRVAARVRQTATANPSWGEMLASLLQKVSLPDEEVLRAYAHQRHRKYDWPRQVERVRHKLIHEGALGLKRRDMDRTMTTLNHLLDILLRIVFKRLDYDGHYQPPCLQGTADTAVDWVKPTTSARSLGYR